MPSEFEIRPIKEIDGVLSLEFPTHSDSRGVFQKIYGNSVGLAQMISLRQVNISSNPKTGTLRGMHFQIPPFHEYKLVTCIQGKVFDVLVDLRPDSQTYKSWFGTVLTAEESGILVPPMVAHGYQTLEVNTTLLYLHSADYSSSHSRGLNPFDSTIGIRWPIDVTEISFDDQNLPFFQEIIGP